MARKKTSFSIDEEVWKRFLIFTIEKTGTARKASELVEEALREYMSKHKT